MRETHDAPRLTVRTAGRPRRHLRYLLPACGAARQPDVHLHVRRSADAAQDAVAPHRVRRGQHAVGLPAAWTGQDDEFRNGLIVGSGDAIPGSSHGVLAAARVRGTGIVDTPPPHVYSPAFPFDG